jgi:hypothetical protein
MKRQRISKRKIGSPVRVPGPARPHGPVKQYEDANVGNVVQINFAFLEHLWEEKPLWGEPGKRLTLRDHLFGLQNTEELRTALALERIYVDEGVRIMVVDIENARTNSYGPDIKPEREQFYVLVLPPALRRETKDPTKEDYLHMQAWSGAWYHATSDGYGM